jgi:hypothetical protein
MTTGLQEQQPPVRNPPPSFRLDVPLHDLLKQPKATRPLAPPPVSAQPEKLPEPVFPQYPQLLTDQVLDADAHGSPTDPYKRHWTAPMVYRALRGWMFPYSGQWYTNITSGTIA